MSITPASPAAHDVRDLCLCFGAQRAARALARRFDAAFRPLGLTSGQFSLLYALQRPVGVSGAAALLGLDRTTLTAALKPLVRRGLAAVTTDPADQRGRRLALTAQGSALLDAAIPVWRACHDDLEAELGDGGGQTLRRGLDALAGRDTN